MAEIAQLAPRSHFRKRAVAAEVAPAVEFTALPPVEYPETDGNPMPDSNYQGKAYRYAVEAVRAHFAHRPEVFVGGDMFIYLEEGNKHNCIAPDLFVSLGGADQEVDTYKVWEQPGGMPDFVMEIVSPSTWREDRDRKRIRYAALGIGEYWLHDPRSRLMNPPLSGHRLVGGVYELLPSVKTPAGELRSYSETLGLELRAEGGRLRFYDPDKERYLLDATESLAVIEAGKAARLTAEAELRAAKARIAELERVR